MDQIGLIRAVVHYDMMSVDERVELAQELSCADDFDDCLSILSRWNFEIRDSKLIDLEDFD